MLRISLCVLAAIIIWATTHAWAPPFTFRAGDIPPRDILASIDFEIDDPDSTEAARQKARSLSLAVYDHDASSLEQLRAELQNKVDRLLAATTIDAKVLEAWQEFEPAQEESAPAPTTEQRQQAIQEFQAALQEEDALTSFRQALVDAFAPLEQRGLLGQLPEEHLGNQEKIFVRRGDQSSYDASVAVSDILAAGAAAALQKDLSEKIASPEVADRVFTWLRPKQLPDTLTLNLEATRAAQEAAAEAVPEVKKLFPAGGPEVLASAGVPMDAKSLELLHAEHRQKLSQQTLANQCYRSLAAFGMYIALYTLCGFYVNHHAPTLFKNLQRFFSLLTLVVATVVLCRVTAADSWRAEMIPLLLFSMTIAIAYKQELALLLSSAVALIVVFSLGHGLLDIVILTSGVAAAILFLKTVRSRSKLLYVGLWTAAVVVMTTLGAGTIVGYSDFEALSFEALRYGLWAVIAGSLMTCLLPFIERLFDVQTDISLIELGDPAHPLLQELVRRAPGTYNHSITVASLAEAAAESIGARGLLVRVGAYFHDIGKMLKPGYFVENQGKGDNRHESLVPAMSTLVIIAHVKDGADLARQHHLPETIIDFILQHHGTTLVEYFYRRASEQSEADPDGGEVDESAFRYPGPKPQTKEAGILMLSDCVESASRVLVEPTPARIESLVQDLAMKRLLDGQFNECGLTLQEVHTIQESLVKSLTAVYHGRVKYPDQQTA